MSSISRRHLLKAGGALGVFTAVSAATPMAWAWNSRQSVAGGNLDTDPPDLVWDPECDEVVRRLFEEEGITRIDELNALLRPWHRNDQALPAGLPPYLASFIQSARQAPSWMSTTRLARGFDFYQRRGTYTGILYGLGSGIMSCAIPDEARAVYHSKGGEDMQDRVSKTAKLGYDIGTQDAFAPSGQMIVTCIKTRLAHSGVRHLITSSPRWQDGGDIPAPISQRDLMVTWHSLATFIHRTLRSWGVSSTNAQTDGFLHVWQVTAHYLGIQHQYIPATWADAEFQSDQTLDPVLGPTPEGISLCDTLLGLASIYDMGITRPLLEAFARYMCGTNNAGQKIGDMLEIPSNPYWDSALRNMWPWFVRAREMGLWFPGSSAMYWAFDEVLRLGVLWGLHQASPSTIYIEIPTANRSEDSYGYPA